MLNHLKLSGTPREMGYKHGETFRKQILELFEIRNYLLEGFWKQISVEQKKNIFIQQITALKKRPMLFEEFEALATASTLTLDQLMIVNNYTDMRDFLSDEGCSSWYVQNSKGVFAGQTWDMHASATPYVLHLEIEKEAGKKLNIITVMGCLGLAGVSSQGQVVLINNMHCKEADANGLMWPACVRMMLENNNSQEAKKTLQQNLPSSGHNYLLADRNQGLNIETTGKRIEVTHHIETSGLVFHTNHYVGSLIETENISRRSKTTLSRYSALENLFSTSDWKNWNFKTLCSKLLLENTSQHLCIPTDPLNPHAGSTCGGIVVDLSSQEAEIFKGFYSANVKNCFSIE